MTTVVEYPLSIAGMYQYHDVIGLLSGGGPGFSGPVAVALGPDGLLHVANRANPNQPEAVRVSRCTIDGDFVGEFFGWGEALGQFIWITAIAFGPDGDLYLSDENTHRISVFTPQGEFLRCWGTEGSGPGQLKPSLRHCLRPNGKSPGGGFAEPSFVQRFTPQGDAIGVWGDRGEGPGQFRMPWGVAIDSAGDVYVSDWRNDRIQKFDCDGAWIATFDGYDGGEGFRRPNGLAVDAHGRIYVCDWWNDRVQVLDASGRVIDTLIGHSGTSRWARTFLNANPDIEEKLNAASQNIELKRRFYRPTAITISNDGLVFVADCYRHRVQIYQRL